MDILYVILTALLVVAAVTMILKKVDTRLTFLFLGVIGLDAERCAAAVTLYKVGHSPYSFLHSWNALQWSSQVLQHLSHSG